METIVEHLEARVLAIRNELDKITRQINELAARRDKLQNDLRSYEGTLEAERRSDIGPQLPLPGTVSRIIVDAAPIIRVSTDEVNRSEYARRFAQSHPEGFAPGDLLRALIAEGIETNPAYIYALLHRNQKMGHIKQRRRKWYPVTTSENGSQVLSTEAETPAA